MNSSRRAVIVLALLACVLSACGREGTRSASAKKPSGTTTTRTITSAGVDPRAPEHVFQTTLQVRELAVPDEVSAGQTAKAVFAARPESSCQIKISYMDGDILSELPPAIVNKTGVVSWTWAVPDDADPGHVRAFVVCSGGQRGEADTTISA